MAMFDPGSRTQSVHYGADKKQLLEQKAKLKELFDSALAESMTSEKSRKMSEILIK